MENLDLWAAQAAQAIIRGTVSQKPTDVDNLLTKALGVLQENGIYAAMLFLYSRTRESDQAVSDVTQQLLLQLAGRSKLVGADTLRDFLQKDGVARKRRALPGESNNPAMKEATNAAREAGLMLLTDHICSDLDKLLLAKQLWEQTLIYARYGAKAREEV